jgi:putative endopeptidase
MSLNPADLDRSVDPGVDFYRFANGGWLDSHPIPAGYGAWGAFEEVNERNEVVLLELLERAAKDPVNDLDRTLGDYYASGLDVVAVEAGGTGPIDPYLALVDDLRTHDDLLALLPVFHRAGLHVLFGWSVTPDHDDATRNLLWLAQGGLGLPDRDAYFAEDAKGQALRDAYVEHVAAQLTNLGAEPATARERSAAVLEMETHLASLHLRGEDKRDPGKILNRHDLAELAALAPSLDLPGYLAALGATSARSVNVQNPHYLADLPAVVEGTDLPTLQAYLRFHVVRETADALPLRFDEESFAFYGRKVLGKQEQLARPKRVVAALTADMGEALSQRFVAQTFPADAKQRALSMVEAILAEMRRSLGTRAWMGEQTRSRGLAKLDALSVKIGYPDAWRDWSGLAITRESYGRNRLRAAAFEAQRLLAKLDQPVDTAEWEMPPHVVNAYYHPIRNEIVFPAGILQPPMFDAAADDAVNFGAIGAVIGHEVTHGFDDQGRRFDADGAFRDWWSGEDEERFKSLADRLVAQFDEYAVVDGLTVNGRLTLGENIADLGGVALSQRAHARLADGAPPVDGFTPAQRFFLAGAAVWRANTSAELERTLVQMDPHSPRPLRVSGPLSNLDAFQQAFDLADDAPMMRPPGERIEIW